MPEEAETLVPAEAETPLPAASKLKVVTQQGCVPCEEILEMLKDDIAAGYVETIPVESPEGMQFAESHNVAVTPTIFLDTAGKLSPCQVIRHDDGSIEIDCEMK